MVPMHQAHSRSYFYKVSFVLPSRVEGLATQSSVSMGSVSGKALNRTVLEPG